MFKRILLFVGINIAVILVLQVAMAILSAVSGGQINAGTSVWIPAAIIGFTGAFISLAISRGVALRAVNGRLIDAGATGQDGWVYSTVARLAQQSGIKMPQVAIYDAPEINAFATGPTRNRSLVAVSTGLLSAMEQGEAEAVIAHEIAHASNGDMVTMTLLQGVLNTFIIGVSRIISNAVARDSAIANFAINMLLQIGLGFGATIIQMWFSRHREFRADAGSARLVGKQKMIAALKRLLGQASHVQNESQYPESVAAMRISGKFGNLFASHPPLEERIRRLEAISSIGR